MKIPVVIQMQPGENGAAALCMMLGYYKKYVSLEEMREVCICSRNGSSPQQIVQAAKQYGMDASVTQVPASDLPSTPMPALVTWRRKYYAIVKSIRRGIVTVVDPSSGEYKLTWEKFQKLYAGNLISLKKGEAFEPGGKREPLISLIWGRLKALKWPFCILGVLTVLCVWLNLKMTYIRSDFMDEVLGQEGKANAGIVLLLTYLTVLLLYTLFSMLKTWLANKASRDTSGRSGSLLFKKILDQPLHFFEQYSAWNLISRINSNMTLDNTMITALAPRIVDAAMTVVYIVNLLSNEKTLALACLLLVILSTALTLAIQTRSAIMSRSMVSNGTAVSSSLLNGMNMIETIKSTGSERDFYNKWYEYQTRYNQSRMGRFKYSIMASTVSTVSQGLLTVTQLFLGAWLVTRGRMTLGAMALFQSILNSMITAINHSLDTVDTLQTMRTDIERVNDINHRESNVAIPLDEATYGEPNKLDGSVRASHLCYRYNPGDALAVDDVSFEVKPGQMVAIVGQTGCGKSTVLKLLADLYTPESGEILYQGMHRQEIPDVVFQASVGTVDQEAVMFEDSIYNNIRMWDDTIEQFEVVMAARDARIEERILRNIGDYSAIILENGRNYSGGELQRLELARALAHEPTLLLLDEFTSALDALTEDKVMKAIRDKGTTCVIVAHRLSTIVDCDRIYVMERGRIVQQGTHGELYAQEGLYRQLIEDGDNGDGNL